VVGRTIIGCLSEVDYKLRHRCVYNEWAVEGEKEALDSVELR
jgi:hypothetical protein